MKRWADPCSSSSSHTILLPSSSHTILSIALLAPYRSTPLRCSPWLTRRIRSRHGPLGGWGCWSCSLESMYVLLFVFTPLLYATTAHYLCTTTVYSTLLYTHTLLYTAHCRPLPSPRCCLHTLTPDAVCTHTRCCSRPSWLWWS
jgi:hypothetical protein